jgi:hypothetical protein
MVIRDMDHACLWFRRSSGGYHSPFAFRVPFNGGEMLFVDSAYGAVDANSRKHKAAGLAVDAGLVVVNISFSFLRHYLGGDSVDSVARALELKEGRIVADVPPVEIKGVYPPERTFSSKEFRVLEASDGRTLMQIDGKRVLFGFDTREYAVPTEAMTIANAVDSFTPQAVTAAKQERLPLFRQGNWWFVRRSKELTAEARKTLSKDFVLPEAKSTNHFISLGRNDASGVWVSGRLVHRCGSGHHGVHLQLDGLWSAHTSITPDRLAS